MALPLPPPTFHGLKKKEDDADDALYADAEEEDAEVLRRKNPKKNVGAAPPHRGPSDVGMAMEMEEEEEPSATWKEVGEAAMVIVLGVEAWERGSLLLLGR